MILLTLAWERPAQGDASALELRERLTRLGLHRPSQVPQGALTSISYLLDVAARVEKSFPQASVSWQRRAARYLESAEKGIDPYFEERGKITNRGYDSRSSLITQGYAVYLPPDYDPRRKWPLYIALHGGSSNGSLFLGVVLGNNMSWKEYNVHLWDDYAPRWSPEWVVVAPDGFGQVMWRWMAEQDVLDVIEDVQRNYAIDPDRVVLGGLSNGGVGAYSIGMRHAWRFSAVQAMAGAPSWLQYAGGRPLPEEETAMKMVSGFHLAENSVNTRFTAYHGRVDPGPMKPSFVEAFAERVAELGLPTRVQWYNEGHDILYIVHRHGRIYDQLGALVRNPRPRQVSVVTGDYRANRQHWVTVTRIEHYPELATVHANVEETGLRVETTNVRAFSIDLQSAPVPENAAAVDIQVDGATVYSGSRSSLGPVIHLYRADGKWKIGLPPEVEGVITKRPLLSGPLTDIYFDRCVHVYGTRNQEHIAALKATAERGSQGWPLWLWNFRQKVVADTEVTGAMMKSAHLILYGTPGDNSVLEGIKDRLPVRVDAEGVVLGSKRYSGPSLGTRFIYPNPLAPGRYVVVQMGNNLEAVDAGHNLPDFLPDYVIYDAKALRQRTRLTAGANRPLSLGYFNQRWGLEGGNGISEGDERPPSASSEHASHASDLDEGAAQGENGTKTSTLMDESRAPPPEPTVFAAPKSDPAGRIARIIARRVSGFPNFRAQIPYGSWIRDPNAAWKIRSGRACLRALREKRIPVKAALVTETSPVPVPVEITGPVDGVKFRSLHLDRTIVVACELAARLPALAEVLKRHQIRSVGVVSSQRDQPRASFHSMGLALDVSLLCGRDGCLTVESDFLATPDRETCAGPPSALPSARKLWEIVCELGTTHVFSSVLTPNYNAGHRDHFHIDVRPDDPRIFVR